MPSRLLARLMTGPVAFLFAGAADMAAGWGRWTVGRMHARLSRARVRARARLPIRSR